MRVVIIKEFVKSNFPSTPLLDYALEVEKITTSKVSLSLSLSLSLAYLCPCQTSTHVNVYSLSETKLNVDGVIAVSFVDLLRQSGALTPSVIILKSLSTM